jgi:hypothetical protein
VKIPYRLKKVHYESQSDKMTSFAGLKLATDLAAKLGILEGLNRLSFKKRQRGVPVADFVMSLVHNFLVGGQCLTDLEALRSEAATRRHLYDLEVPAPTTAGETLRKFQTGHIKQLESVIAQGISAFSEKLGGDDAVLLDMDSSVFPVHGYKKEGAAYGYTRENGLHPLLCFWSNHRILLGCRLRAGNRHTADGALSFIDQCVGRLPCGRRITMRLDAGFYSHDIVEHLVSKSIAFSITAHMTTALKTAIAAVDEAAWKKYPWEDLAEYAEIQYRPAGWGRSFRMLVKRTPLYEKNQRVLFKHHHVAAITDMPGAAPSLIRHHFARGGAENFIEEFKNGIGARLLPSQKFNANWAWCVIAQLAHNLAQFFKLLVLPKDEHCSQMKSLRLHWFCIGARFIRSGRKLVVALARGPDTSRAFGTVERMIHAL